jgi:hypothetical protein
MRNSIMDRDGIISFNACKDGPEPIGVTQPLSPLPFVIIT